MAVKFNTIENISSLFSRSLGGKCDVQEAGIAIRKLCICVVFDPGKRAGSCGHTVAQSARCESALKRSI